MSNSEPLISVIVPVYNVEKYLHRCVDSIIHQSYHNLEIIIVDDGSTDDSAVMCDEYSALDNRIVVIHKQNGGLSSARNEGIDIAHGEYLSFIDSDDYIDKFMLEKLYTALTENDADISVCNYQNVYENDFQGMHIVNQEIKFNVVTPLEAISKTDNLEQMYSVVAWNKLYKKELFLNIRYAEGYIHEDAIIMHRLFGECEKIVIIPDRLYFYQRRNGSIMGIGFNIERLDLVRAMSDQIIFYHEKGWYELENTAGLHLWWYMNKYYLRFEKNEVNRMRLNRTLQDFRKALPYLLRSDNISFKEKITILIFAVSPLIYRILLKYKG